MECQIFSNAIIAKHARSTQFITYCCWFYYNVLPCITECVFKMLICTDCSSLKWSQASTLENTIEVNCMAPMLDGRNKRISPLSEKSKWNLFSGQKISLFLPSNMAAMQTPYKHTKNNTDKQKTSIKQWWRTCAVTDFSPQVLPSVHFLFADIFSVCSWLAPEWKKGDKSRS